MKRLKQLSELFLSMMKIGAFTFGGGYAMIHMLDHEFVDSKGWLDKEEFMDLVTVAESTPGPIAINCATYIGYKKDGILGSLVATLGMIIPSFTVIFLVSLFFDRFLASSVIAAAFRGIRVCVVFLIFSAGMKMLKKMKKKAFPLTVFSLTFVAMITLSLLAVSFSSIFYVLISGCLGALVYSIGYCRSRQEKNGGNGE